MKNKKAFTLVELLGVIVVLAILSLITIPILTNVINDMRIKSLQSSAYGLVEASNLYFIGNDVDGSVRFDKNNTTDTLKELSYKGTVKQGTVIIDKKGQVTVCITDGKNSAYKNYNEKKVTISKGKICSVKENSSIVYLDDVATITALSNIELTTEIESLKSEIATLKDKQDNTLKKIYPVGSIYISMNDTNPSTLFGGTWERLPSGRTLLETGTNASGTTGGSSTASFTPAGTVGDTTLSENQMPSHRHRLLGQWGVNPNITESSNRYAPSGKYAQVNGNLEALTYPDVNAYWISSSVISQAGNSQPHTHTFTGNQETIDTVPPYITVYMYKRTA